MDEKTALKQLEFIEKHPSIKKMRLAAESWASDFQTLISIILSARTLDETTIEVCKKLFEEHPSPKELSSASIKEIEKIINPINFYQNKSKYIINCSKEILQKFNGKVPNDFEKLVTLPGVGRKTANVFLAQKGGDNIGVDTHVSYISQKLGWTKNKNPDKIEKDLTNLFPKNYWKKINKALVRFGKSHTSRFYKNKLLEDMKKIK